MASFSTYATYEHKKKMLKFYYYLFIRVFVMGNRFSWNHFEKISGFFLLSHEMGS